LTGGIADEIGAAGDGVGAQRYCCSRRWNRHNAIAGFRLLARFPAASVAHNLGERVLGPEDNPELDDGADHPDQEREDKGELNETLTR
jgi:hypothetical protein